MINRRAFLAATGSAAAGALVMNPAMRAMAQSRGKQVMVGGNEVVVVDIHAHCLFQEVRPIIEGTPLANAPLQDMLVLGQHRIDALDERGIDIAALSVNRFWWYEATEEQAEGIVKINDEGLAEWCATHPDRFVPLSSPALQFPEMAAEQLEYAVTELGHRGASILGHAQGEAPSTEKYDPFWAKGRRAWRSGLHAPRRVQEHHSARLTGRYRRTRQRDRQPAGDDAVPFQNDLRRRSGPLPEPQGGGRPRRRVPAVPTWEGPRLLAQETMPIASTRRTQAST